MMNWMPFVIVKKWYPSKMEKNLNLNFKI
jgi:hypothetical protein